MNEIKNKLAMWKQGMQNLSPAQQLRAQVVGYLGTTLGLALAIVVLLWKGMWYIVPVLAFGILLSVVSYIGARQKYVAAANFEALISQRKEEELNIQLQEKAKQEDEKEVVVDQLIHTPTEEVEEKEDEKKGRE